MGAILRLALAVLSLAGCRIGFGIAGADAGQDAGQGAGDTVADSGDSVTVPGATEVQLSSGHVCAVTAWDGAAIGVTWITAQQSWFARYDLDGTLVQGPLLVASGSPMSCGAIVFAQTHFLIAQSFGTVGNGDIDIYRVDTSGVSAPIPLVRDAGDSKAPSLAVRGNQVVLAWRNLTGQNLDVFAQRLNLDGTSAANRVALSSINGNNHDPIVVATTSGFAVVWSAGSPHLRELDANGAAAGNELVVGDMISAEGPIGATWSGTDLIIAASGSNADPALTTACVSMTGAVTNGPHASGASYGPSMAWNGASGVIAYVGRDGSPQPPIHLAAIGSDGALGAITPLAPSHTLARPRVAVSGARYTMITETTSATFLTILPP
jgi:hypothetical protein